MVSAPLAYPGWLASLLNSPGGMVVPLALVSIGLQLHRSAIAAIYVCLLRHLGDTDRVTLFESAMAPMIGGSVIAMQCRLNDELTSMMVALGTVASFVTVPAWWGCWPGCERFSPAVRSCRSGWSGASGISATCMR